MSGVVQVGMWYVAMTRWGFVRYVRMASIPRRRNTQILLLPSSLAMLVFVSSLATMLTNLAPITTVLLLKIPRSMNTYKSAGKVDRASKETVSFLRSCWTQGAALTPKEEGQRGQRAIFALETFEEGRQRQHVHERMEEVEVHERERVRPVGCMKKTT